MRPDSLGYDGNPFDVRVRIINSGETRADSVRALLVLPADVVLDPPTQQNPIVIGTLQPVPIGDAHFEVAWTARYTGATRAPRSDSLVVQVTGKNIAGGAVAVNDTMPMSADGIAPAYTLTIDAPAALQYDTAAVYAPLPLPVGVTVKNISQQHVTLPGLLLAISGDGVTPRQSLSASIGRLAPQETKSFAWDMDIARASAPRTVTFTATSTDADTVARSVQASTAIPGRPFSLDIASTSAPDTVPRNAEKTGYLISQFEVSFSVRNAFWKNVRVASTRILPMGTGVIPGAAVEDFPGNFLKPDEVSPPYSASFRIVTGLPARDVIFEVRAISTEGDTAVRRVTVHIPALVPRVSLHRTGLDSLAIDAPSQSYRPNPFEQRFVVRNDGSAPVTLDSLTVDALGDGVTRIEKRTFIFLQPLPAQQESPSQSWTFSVEKRTKPRHATIAYTAHFNKTERVTDTADVYIPGFEPLLRVELDAPSRVDYDSLAIYAPTQITLVAVARNTGPIAFRLDSMQLVPSAPWGPAPSGSQRVDVLLQPGDSARVTWPLEFVPSMLSDTLRSRFIVTAYFDSSRSGGAEHAISIPGRPTTVRIDALPIPSVLTIRPDGTGYVENPLVTSFRVFNDSWVRQTLASTSFTVTGTGVRARTPLTRTPGSVLSPLLYSAAIIDTLDVDPATDDRTVVFSVDAVSSLGLIGAFTHSIAIPKIVPTDVETVSPRETALLAPYPNPSTTEDISIPFSLARGGTARLEVFDALGQRVASLADGVFSAGTRVLRWSARAAPGVYIVRLTAEGRVYSRRVVLR
ncbi:MAG: T9SS type A sorting domain-containing protein [Ignavibacteria bacterium]|nr:T9SS type A sorting domain-containing protein [Ignavibacteria bacterium]